MIEFSNINILLDYNILNIRSNYIIVFEIIGIISAFLALTTNNPIVCLGFFINLICNSAFYLVAQGISFIGYTYILIYVGAIAILFLFIIMLLNVQSIDYMSIFDLNDELSYNTLKYSENHIVYAYDYDSYKDLSNYLLIVIIFLGLFFILIFNIISPIENINTFNNILSLGLNNSLFSIGIDTYLTNIQILELSDITILGKLFYSDYSILFIIIAFMLLLSILAAIYLVSLT